MQESLGLDIDHDSLLRTREYIDYPDPDDDDNDKFVDDHVQSEYLLPIATGDPDLDNTDHSSPHEIEQAAEHDIDPLSLDDPLSLALRRNRHILNPTSSNQSASTSSTKGKLKTALSGSATSIKDMLTMSRSSSRGDVGEDALSQTMVSGVPTSRSWTYLSSLPRSESKGYMGKMKTSLSRSSTMLTSSMVSSSSKSSSSLNYLNLQDSLDESIAPDRKCISDPVYHKQLDIKTLILLNAEKIEENLRPQHSTKYEK